MTSTDVPKCFVCDKISLNRFVDDLSKTWIFKPYEIGVAVSSKDDAKQRRRDKLTWYNMSQSLLHY